MPDASSLVGPAAGMAESRSGAAGSGRVEISPVHPFDLKSGEPVLFRNSEHGEPAVQVAATDT